MKEGSDYEIISKEQWMLFDQELKVQGVPTYPIRRYFEKEGKGIKTFIDIHYQKVKLILVNY